MKVSAPNGVKVRALTLAHGAATPDSPGGATQVYNVAGGKSLPEWLSDKKREALRKDEEFRRRIELIQARA